MHCSIRDSLVTFRNHRVDPGTRVDVDALNDEHCDKSAPDFGRKWFGQRPKTRVRFWSWYQKVYVNHSPRIRQIRKFRVIQSHEYT